MAVRQIEPTDTLETGFRAKYNETIREIITAGEITADGKLRLKKFDNSGTIDIPLLGLFYTQQQIDQMFSAGLGVPNASEIARGIIEIATQEEMDLGDDDTRAATPYKIRNSTMFPFKGPWVEPDELDFGYLLGNIVIKDNFMYVSLTDGNKTEPSLTEESDWQLIGVNPDSTPVLADGVITPGVIEIDVDSLATFTTQFSYRLGGVVYDPVQADLQLDDSDPTYSRIDIIYGKNDGTYGFTTGIASPTYETPLPPANTILLAKILRKTDGSNIISVIGTTGYVEQILAVMYGDTFHKYGSNIYLDSAEGTDDSGDIVTRKKTGADFEETGRIYKALNGVKKFIARFEGDPDQQGEIFLSINRTPIPVTGGDLTDGNLTIAWQTDPVPNDVLGRTYVERFGNIIQDITNVWDDAGIKRKASPSEWYYTVDVDDNIDTVTINTLFEGTISIL